MIRIVCRESKVLPSARSVEPHALERLISLTDSEDALIVTITGIHLANRLGYALEAAFKGHSDYQYNDDEYGLSVSWTCDD